MGIGCIDSSINMVTTAEVNSVKDIAITTLFFVLVHLAVYSIIEVSAYYN